jgi:hypothetical protein
LISEKTLKDYRLKWEALRGGLLDLIEVQLLAVGGGPTLDFESATAFLATFETMIEKVRRRRLP